MSQNVQLQQCPITLDTVIGLIQPVHEYFNRINDQGSLQLLGQVKEKLATGKLGDLETAVETLRRLHLSIPLEEADARKYSAVLWVNAGRYHYQANKYNQH